MSNDVSYSKAVICLCFCVLMGFACVMLLPTVVLSPAMFVMCFTLGMISFILMMAFVAGPRVYLKKLFIEKNLYASVAMLASIILALWFSVV